jgi:hypothetical protein
MIGPAKQIGNRFARCGHEAAKGHRTRRGNPLRETRYYSKNVFAGQRLGLTHASDGLAADTQKICG